ECGQHNFSVRAESRPRGPAAWHHINLKCSKGHDGQRGNEKPFAAPMVCCSGDRRGNRSAAAGRGKPGLRRSRSPLRGEPECLELLMPGRACQEWGSATGAGHQYPRGRRETEVRTPPPSTRHPREGENCRPGGCSAGREIKTRGREQG